MKITQQGIPQAILEITEMDDSDFDIQNEVGLNLVGSSDKQYEVQKRILCSSQALRQVILPAVALIMPVCTTDYLMPMATNSLRVACSMELASMLTWSLLHSHATPLQQSEDLEVEDLESENLEIEDREREAQSMTKKIFALGIALIELSGDFQIELFRVPQDLDIDSQRAFITEKTKLMALMRSRLGKIYEDVVRRCVYFDFDIMDVDDLDFGIVLVRRFLEGVVVPVERLYFEKVS